MKLHYTDPAIRPLLFQGQFGLEKESLRIYRNDGRMAQTLHPFDNPHIVRDFAENQTEINTGIHRSWQSARAECERLTRFIETRLFQQNEMLWTFSNPPIIDFEEQIPMLESDDQASMDYRQYLANRYGRRKMTYCGIHYNFSFLPQLIDAEYAQYCADSSKQEKVSRKDFQDSFYLELTKKAIWYGWILNVLFNSSPLYDGSLFDDQEKGKTHFAGTSSMRNGIMGYWNFFTPSFDFSSMDAYTRSIENYVQIGLLKAPRELYYPVRLKPAGSYSMDNLRNEGADHIELRMLDLNPYEISGIARDDAWFAHLFLIYIACLDDVELNPRQQMYAIHNFKSACALPLSSGRILFELEQSMNLKDAAMQFLEDMASFFTRLGTPESALCVKRQMRKIEREETQLHSSRIRMDFPAFFAEGVKYSRLLQQRAMHQDYSDKIPAERSDAFRSI